jgi:hypothetical protein
MFLLLRVKGPFLVPVQRTRNGARLITNKAKATFWEGKSQKYRSRIGCYVFAINNGQHYSPGYVGMATKSFGAEVFSESKLNRYNEALSDYKKGRPVLFLVVAPIGKGKPAKHKVAAIERHLIQAVKAAYPRLRNKIGTKAPRWGIVGVLRGGKGKTGAGARALRQMMGTE